MLTSTVTRLTFDPVVQIAHHESGNASSLSPDGQTLGFRDFAGNWELLDLNTGTRRPGPRAGRHVFYHENQPVEVVRSGDFHVLRRFNDHRVLLTLPEIDVPGAVWFDWRIMPSGNNELTDWVWFEQIDSTLNNWSVVRANLVTGAVDVARVADLTGEQNPVRRTFRHHEAFWDGDRAFIGHNARGPGFDLSDWKNEFWEVTMEGRQIAHTGWAHATISQGEYAYNFWNADESQFEVRFSGNRPKIVFPGWGPFADPLDREASNHHHLLDGYLISSIEEQREDGLMHQIGVRVYDPDNEPVAFWEVDHQAGPVLFAAALARPFLGYTDVGLTAFWHSDADNVAGAVDLYAASVFDTGTLGPFSPTDPGDPGNNGGGDDGGSGNGDTGNDNSGGGDTGAGDTGGGDNGGTEPDEPVMPDDVYILEGESAFQIGQLNVANPASVPLVVSAGTIRNNGDGTWTWSLDGPLLAPDSQTIYVTIPGSTGSVNTFELVVRNAAPTVDFGQPPIISAGATLARTLIAEDLGFDYLEATINYGDGSSPEVVFADPETGAFEISHQYLNTGFFPLTIQLDDGRGGLSNQSSIVRVTPPEIDIEISQLTSAEIAFSGTGEKPVITVLARNVGLLSATGLVIEDSLTLPEGVSIESAVPSTGTWIEPIWSVGDLPTGDTVTLTITLSVDQTAAASVDGIVNTATFSTANETEANPENNSATSTISVVDGVDIGLTILESSPVVEPGTGTGNLSYTVTATNHGNSPASAVIIENELDLPAGVAIESVSSNTTVIGGITNWWVGNLGPGATETLVVNLTVDESASPAEDAISLASNVAFLSSADLVPANDTAFEATSIAVPVDIELTQTQSSESVIAQVEGDELVYSITARNLGPADATGVQIRETLGLPDHVEVESVLPSAGSWNDPIWQLDRLATGATETLTITLTAGTSAAPGPNLISSTADLQAVNEPDANAANDNVTNSASILAPTVDIAVEQTVTTLETGIDGSDQLVFQIRAINNGPAMASEVSIEEILETPPGVTVDTVIATAGRWDSTNWMLDRLPAGQTETLTLILSTAGASPGEVISRAQLSSVHEPDLDNTNDAAEQTAVIEEQGVDVAIEQMQSTENVEPGSSVVYTITATNHGSLPASTVVIQNNPTLPDGVRIDSSTATAGNYLGTVWLLESLAGGASETLTLHLVVDATSPPGSDVISNTAEVVFMQQPDMDPQNNSAVQSTSIIAASGSVSDAFALHISRDAWVIEPWQLQTAAKGGNRILPWIGMDALSVTFESPQPSVPTLLLEKLDSGETLSVDLDAWDGVVANFSTAPLPTGHYRATVNGGSYDFSVLPADSNGSSRIDLIDFSILSFNFGSTQVTVPAALADYNGDGTVNLIDFSILSFGFGTSLPALPPVAPQPTSAELFALAEAARSRTVDEIFADEDSEEEMELLVP